MDEQMNTTVIELEEGVTATEYREGCNPLLHRTVFTHSKWPSPIVFDRSERSANTVYKFTSEQELPKAIQGTFSDLTLAYDTLVEATKGHKWKPKSQPIKTILDKLDEEEKEQASVATWEEKYREGLVYVHESRLVDGSTMVVLEVHEPIALSLKSVKKRTDQFYTLQGEVPFDLQGQNFSTVRNMAKAVSSHATIESMA